ncbi:MAG: exported protein of unknown function [Promethearchaeota archaeon]|nr:MAG: exported protein of unknown function [Candidatus Lokiarchaeota archaeon]
MKYYKKTAFALIATVILVSFVSTFPASSGVYIPSPIAPSSIKSSQNPIADAFKSHFGHDLTEEYWSILYDLTGNHTEVDYNPGPYNGSRSEGNTDDIPEVDTKFFIGWNNLGNIQSLYCAMDNFSWNVNDNNNTLYGCAPYQFFLQHFTSPFAPNNHIFVLNKFLGLLAYRDNLTDGIEDLPDENDTLYIGWPQYSEYHKFLINELLNATGVAPWYLVNESKVGDAVPIPMTKISPGVYEFGMSYQNIFILWQSISVDEGLNNETTNIDILSNCSAFSLLSYINFTFRISITNTLLGTQVVTTTEYDIGTLDSLYVIGDNGTIANNFEGTSFNITIPLALDVDIGHYNTTSAIGKRLDGNKTLNVPGFGLSVINSAHVAVIRLIEIGNFQIPSIVDLTNFTDEIGNKLGNATQNISRAGISHGSGSYTIDFASKPTYTWDNGTHSATYDAPTRVLRNTLFELNTTTFLDLAAINVIAMLILRAQGTGWQGWLAALTIIGQLYSNQFLYITSFPKWSGAQITQDPTFSVFVPNIIPPLPSQEEGGLPWGIILPVIFIIGICSAVAIGAIIWKRKRK